MSVFRAEVLGACLLACATQVWAQTPPAAPRRPAPPAIRSVLPQSQVQVEALGAPEGPAAGLLDSSNGGLGQGIWADTPRERAEELLAQLPLATTVPSIHALARRLLLTTADAPSGVAPEPFIFARVQKLLGAGLLDDAADLAMQAQLPENTDFAWLRASAILLAGHAGNACGPATASRLENDEPFWMELRAYCYAQEGNADALELTRQVMHARGLVDRAFDVLLDDVVSHKTNDPGEIANPNPLHLYLLRALRLPIDRAVDAELGLPADVVAMRDSSDSPAQRIRAAEAAARAGAASPLELASIADAQTFTPEQIDNAATAAVTLPFLEGQALLRQALARATDPDAKAALLRKAFALGAENNEPVLAAQLQTDAAASLKPDLSLRDLAPFAARALLLAGQTDAAESWTNALDWNAIPDRTFASVFAATIALAAPNDVRAAAAQKALAWLSANKDSSPVTSDYAALAFGLYRALGLAVPPMPTSPVLPATAQQAPQTPASDPAAPPGRRPPPQLRMQFAAGIDDPGRKGEAILALLAFIGKDGPVDVAPDVTSGFVAALVKMGEPDAARALATDALLYYQPPAP